MALSIAPEYSALNPSSVEEEAIVLRWQKIEHQSNPIDTANAVRLLKEIRERMANAEQSAVEFAVKKMSEGRRTPRRKQQVALVIGILVFVLIIAIVTIFK